MIWHDYSPTPRPGIRVTDIDIMESTIYRLIGRIDLRRGWEAGAFTADEMDKRLRMLGWKEEDAADLGDALRRAALLPEIGRVIDDCKRKYVEGYITKNILKADLKALLTHPELVEYHLADAEADREIRIKRAQLKHWRDAFMKEIIDEAMLEAYVEEILVDETQRILFLDDVYLEKHRKPRPIPGLTLRLSRAKGRVAILRERVERYRENISELETIIKETADVYDAQIAKKEVALAIEVEPERIARLEADIRILRERKEAKLASLHAKLTTYQRLLREVEISLSLAEEEVGLLEVKVGG